MAWHIDIIHCIIVVIKRPTGFHAIYIFIEIRHLGEKTLNHSSIWMAVVQICTNSVIGAPLPAEGREALDTNDPTPYLLEYNPMLTD